MLTAENKEIIDAAREEEEWLFRELDKGIEDMEQGRVIPHEEAMQRLRAMLRQKNAV